MKSISEYVETIENHYSTIVGVNIILRCAIQLDIRRELTIDEKDVIINEIFLENMNMRIH